MAFVMGVFIRSQVLYMLSIWSCFSKYEKMVSMIDPDGFRPNVGIILSNDEGKVFWAQRIGQKSWQFPQGGMNTDEVPEEAMYRELQEETGLMPEHVQLLGATKGWLRYRLPGRMMRKSSKPLCIGQKQVWFLLRLTATEDAINLSADEKPEFSGWKWVDYWYPLKEVIYFKREVYQSALNELAPLILDEDGVLIN